MKAATSTLPDPTPEAVLLWLKTLNRSRLHGEGWQTVNQRFHGIARAGRPFIREHFTTPAEQEAAFDGMVLALLAMGRFEDIGKLAHLLTDQRIIESPSEVQ